MSESQPLAAPYGDEADPTCAEIGTRLKEVREYLSLSQQIVASSTGIPRSAISDIERGARKIDSLELRKLARLYRHPMSYFLGDEPDPNESAVALGRALTTLTPEDQNEVIRFAQFLKFSRNAERRTPPT
ncbi:MAG: helix-turn-helix transcriptional regulator [Pseudonocardiales bacterium]|nr:helix-turn-helix transcriptional regulator [Pseudonocardiales bacterium]